MREDLPDHAARALLNLAYTPLERRDYRYVEDDVTRARQFAIDGDLAGYAQYLTAVRAWYCLDMGDWAGAERDARDALGHPEHRGVLIMPALVTLGRLQARRDEPEAAATLDEAARLASAAGELQRVGPAAAARPEHAWLLGDLTRAADEAARGYELAVDRAHPWFAGELAWWLHRSGFPPVAPAWIAEPYRLLLASDWSAAAASWAELGCPYEEADALAAGDDDAELLRALAVFDKLGAAAASRWVRRRLTGRGRVPVPRGPRPTTATNPAQLTSREVEVLGLMATGKRNADIARDLSLSVRTVDHHISAVLRKLDVDSRSLAPAAARRLGIAIDDASAASEPRVD